MDITFRTEEGRFNYRVCAIIIENGKILAMHDERSPYYYLPGGRVALHETAEQALLRELREELEIEARIIRPLWLNQSFFTEDVSQERYHEICLYFLTDVSQTNLLEKGECFTRFENKHVHTFEWLKLQRLRNEYFYPNFLKQEIFSIPDTFMIHTEYE
ncbi:MAG: NUDIX hydrolase [Candidatus Merdivicinus sp.]